MKLRLMHSAVGEIAVTLRPDATVVIGRKGSGSSIELNWDSKVSRRHAKLWLEGDVVFFEDLGSSNGSFLSDLRLEGKIIVEPGTPILVGETVLFVEADDEPLGDFVSETTDTSRILAFVPAIGHEAGFDEGMNTNSLELSLESIEALTETRPAPAPIRARLVSDTLVEVLLPNGRLFREFWDEHHKTGLFVEADDPPSFNHQMKIRVETPEGAVLIPAHVVHIVDEEAARNLRMAQGFGLAFDIRADLRPEVDEFANGTLDLMGPDDAVSGDLPNIMSAAATVLGHFDAGEYYAALGVEPIANVAAIERRIEEILETIGSGRPEANHAQTARLAAAVRAVKKIGPLLADPSHRLRYDFATGHERIEERLAHARRGGRPAVAELRDAWNQAHPDRVAQAASAMRRAFAVQGSDRDEAIRLAQKSLELNPFFEPLRAQLAKWKASRDS